MPCYLFTYHAYGSWLPDRSRGYVDRDRGVQPASPKLAKNCREKVRESEVTFDKQAQQLIVETLQQSCPRLEAHCHAIATDASHVHTLVSWTHDRPWESISKSLKTSLTRTLNDQLSRRRWFSNGSSRKRVKDREHFEYLVTKYLPSHRGVCWTEPPPRPSDA
ncbi:MAG: hypothetical protein AAGA92_04395 [Planctomycetota bacterium]